MLKPKWLALTLVCLLLLPAFNSLSDWQWRRLHQRQAYNAVIQMNTTRPPATLSQVRGTEKTTVAQTEQWRTMHIIGTWDVAHQVLVRKKSYYSEVGFWVVTPLVTTEGTLLINRGWIAAGNSAVDSPAVPAPPVGQVEVSARIRLITAKQFSHPSDMPRGQIDDIDPGFITPDTSVITNAYGEIIASRPDSSTGLKLIAAPDVSEGPHRSYALQWIFFAIMTIIGWIILVRNQVILEREKLEV